LLLHLTFNSSNKQHILETLTLVHWKDSQIRQQFRVNWLVGIAT